MYTSPRVGRGTRQRCPLSHLLFALAIKALSLTLNHTTVVKGVAGEVQEQKVAKRADDLFLFIQFSSSLRLQT